MAVFRSSRARSSFIFRGAVLESLRAPRSGSVVVPLGGPCAMRQRRHVAGVRWEEAQRPYAAPPSASLKGGDILNNHETILEGRLCGERK